MLGAAAGGDTGRSASPGWSGEGGGGRGGGRGDSCSCLGELDTLPPPPEPALPLALLAFDVPRRSGDGVAERLPRG